MYQPPAPVAPSFTILTGTIIVANGKVVSTGCVLNTIRTMLRRTPNKSGTFPHDLREVPPLVEILVVIPEIWLGNSIIVPETHHLIVVE